MCCNRKIITPVAHHMTPTVVIYLEQLNKQRFKSAQAEVIQATAMSY